MPQRPTSILTTLAVSLLALTLIAPWVLGQDPDRLAEIRRRAEQARDIKDDLRTRMTPDQIAQAQEMSATLFDRIN